MKKKTIWINQGAQLADVYIDEINRVYVDNGVFFVIAGSANGIETESENLKNENIRIMFPLGAAKKITEDLNQAVKVLIKDADVARQQEETIVDDKIAVSYGKPFFIPE